MNKKAFVFILLAVITILGTGLCLIKHRVVDFHVSRISLDWDGVYTGIIPSASGQGIDVRLKLNKDDSFELSYKYLNKPNNSFNWKGSFKWNKTGNIITLNTADAPLNYKVAENKVIQLDMNKKPIRGRLANNYVLKKNVEKAASVTVW